MLIYKIISFVFVCILLSRCPSNQGRTQPKCQRGIEVLAPEARAPLGGGEQYRSTSLAKSEEKAVKQIKE